MLLKQLLQRLALLGGVGFDHRLDVLLVLRAEVQGAAQLGKFMGFDRHRVGADGGECRNDVGVLGIPAGNELAIGARRRLFFIGLEIGQSRFQQGCATVGVGQAGVVLLFKNKGPVEIVASTFVGVFAHEEHIAYIQLQVELLFDRVLERLLGEGQDVVDLAKMLFD